MLEINPRLRQFNKKFLILLAVELWLKVPFPRFIHWGRSRSTTWALHNALSSLCLLCLCHFFPTEEESTGWSSWILSRKFQYFIWCLIDLFLFLEWHLSNSNSTYNTSISGVKSSWTSLWVEETVTDGCISRGGTRGKSLSAYPCWHFSTIWSSQVTKVFEEFQQRFGCSSLRWVINEKSTLFSNI